VPVRLNVFTSKKRYVKAENDGKSWVGKVLAYMFVCSHLRVVERTHNLGCRSTPMNYRKRWDLEAKTAQPHRRQNGRCKCNNHHSILLILLYTRRRHFAPFLHSPSFYLCSALHQPMTPCPCLPPQPVSLIVRLPPPLSASIDCHSILEEFISLVQPCILPLPL
jgi:hypothetical protein